jgi:hypothetical protein
MAWASFEHIFTQTNFRLQIATRDPIRLTVEHDAAFGLCLAGSDAWEPGEKAKGWVANRVLELAAQINKTSVRRLCLQVPRQGDEPAIDAFLTGLQRRLMDFRQDPLVVVGHRGGFGPQSRLQVRRGAIPTGQHR